MGKAVLYLGLDPTRYQTDKILVHRPIIQIEKKPFDQKLKEAFFELSHVSIVLLTSRVSAKIFFEYCEKLQIELPKKILYLAVGQATALMLPSAISCREESSEGVCRLLSQLSLDPHRLLFYPHSEQSREVIPIFLREKKWRVIETITYSTVAHPEFHVRDIDRFEEVVFTSPTCVNHFFQKKIVIRAGVKLTTIGSITQNVLIQFLKQGKVI